jgi:hypothetical protein
MRSDYQKPASDAKMGKMDAGNNNTKALLSIAIGK